MSECGGAVAAVPKNCERWLGVGTCKLMPSPCRSLPICMALQESGDVSRMVQFTEALARADNDFDLVQTVRNFTAAKYLARYLAVDRALENWDGPINFRRVDRRWFNHNYFWVSDSRSLADGFMRLACCFVFVYFRFFFFLAFCCSCYPLPLAGGSSSPVLPTRCAALSSLSRAWHSQYESDKSDVIKRQFKIVPWDLDGVLIVDLTRAIVGLRPAWDEPVCAPGVEARPGVCTDCTPFLSTGGLSTQAPPSCFKMVRVFARGLRSEFMEAAFRLVSGPLRHCRIKAKVDRWSAAIAPLMERDSQLGLYPAARAGDYTVNFATQAEDFMVRSALISDNGVCLYWFRCVGLGMRVCAGG